MATRTPRSGKLIRDAEAAWAPLRAAIRAPHDRDFAWLGAVRLTDGTRVDTWVHGWTGRVLRLGDDGEAFGLTPTGRFKRVDRAAEVECAIPWPWQWLEMGGYPQRGMGPELWFDDDEDEPTLDDVAALERLWSLEEATDEDRPLRPEDLAS